MLVVLGGLTLFFGPQFWVDFGEAVWEGFNAPAEERAAAGKPITEFTGEEIALFLLTIALFPAFLLAPVVLL